MTMDKKDKKTQINTKADNSFEERIKVLEEKNLELEDQLKRAVADYRNLERRSSEERIEEIKFANKNLVEALLPAFDTLILAGRYTEDQNIKLTIDRVIEILKDNGIEKIDTNGAKYNADTMEAIEMVNGAEGIVIEELRPGFLLRGKLIRPAQVKVGGKNINNNTELN